MRRRKVWIPIAVVVVLGALIAANLTKKKTNAKSVRVETVGRRTLESWVRAPGRVQPVVSVDMSSNVTGRVDHLAVREGDAVSRGDLLLMLDDTRMRSELAQREALLSAARSQLILTEAQRDLARQILARREELFAGGLLSSEELESARVDLRVKEAQVAAQQDEGVRLRAAVDESERNLAEARFLAPMDGVITALNLEEGENVLIGTMNTPGTVILTVSNLKQMEVEARVNEGDVVAVRRHQRVRIDVDARPDTTLTGRVTSVGESGTRLSRDEGAEFEVHVTIATPPPWLRPGMSADVEILVASADSALAVPIQALVARELKQVHAWERGASEDSTETDAEGSDSLITGVFVSEDGQAHFRSVTTGVRGESFAEILAGLSEEETILSGPYKILRRLKDGEAIKGESRKRDDD